MEMMLSKENLERVAWLATEEGRLIPGMINEIITRYFEEKRLDAFIPQESNGLVNQEHTGRKAKHA